MQALKMKEIQRINMAQLEKKTQNRNAIDHCDSQF